MTEYSGEAVGSFSRRDSSRLRLFERLLGHVRFVDLLAQVIDGRDLFVLFAQFALNGLELLAQEILALRLAHLFLRLALDAFAELQHLKLAREKRR